MSGSPVVSGVMPQVGSCVGSLLFTRIDVQVTPLSALFQMSPRFPVVGPLLLTVVQLATLPNRTGAKKPGQPYTPLRAHCDWPLAVPR